MSQRSKLLADIRRDPRTVRFRELVRVLEAHGVVIRSGKGSHCVALRGGVVYTIKDPGPGRFVHPKTVKHSMEAFGLWEE